MSLVSTALLISDLIKDAGFLLKLLSDAPLLTNAIKQVMNFYPEWTACAGNLSNEEALCLKIGTDLLSDYQKAGGQVPAGFNLTSELTKLFAAYGGIQAAQTALTAIAAEAAPALTPAPPAPAPAEPGPTDLPPLTDASGANVS